MMLPCFLMFAATAFAAPLRVDPAAPPKPAGVRDGLPAYDFGRGVRLGVHPGVVIELAPGASPPAGARSLGGLSWLVPAADPVAASLRLLGEPGVREAFPDVDLPHERRDFDDPLYGGQWYLQDLEMAALYDVALGSADIKVAVIDSGIDVTHPDLASAVVAPYDAFSDDDDPSPDPGEFCSGASNDICDVHGTAVSGIVLARANNGVGIVGMCPQCTLVPIKMLGEGSGAMSADVAAFEHAIAQDVAVINNSWGFTEQIPVPAPLARVIERASTETRGGLGSLVVFAAGNSDVEIGPDELEALPEILCVSAIDTYGYPVNYTNYGDAIDVSAPSATVSIVPGNETTTSFGGTSAASPVAAGLASWAVSYDPSLSSSQLYDLLVSTSTPSPYIPPTDHDDYYGFGTISPLGVLDTLSPEQEDTGVGEEPEPQACGCAASSRAGAPAVGAFGILLAAIVARRRR